MNRVEFSVRDRFRGVITTLAAPAKDQGVEFQINIAGDARISWLVTLICSRRVLRMLVKDAVESTSSNPINLVLRLVRGARIKFSHLPYLQ
jgi:hypothetical protein